MTLTIPPELEARVQQRARTAGLSAEKWLRRIVEEEVEALDHDLDESSAPALHGAPDSRLKNVVPGPSGKLFPKT